MIVREMFWMNFLKECQYPNEQQTLITEFCAPSPKYECFLTARWAVTSVVMFDEYLRHKCEEVRLLSTHGALAMIV